MSSTIKKNILQIMPCEPGWRAVLIGDDGEASWIEPVVMWALKESIEYVGSRFDEERREVGSYRYVCPVFQGDKTAGDFDDDSIIDSTHFVGLLCPTDKIEDWTFDIERVKANVLDSEARAQEQRRAALAAKAARKAGEAAS